MMNAYRVEIKRDSSDTVYCFEGVPGLAMEKIRLLDRQTQFRECVTILRRSCVSWHRVRVQNPSRRPRSDSERLRGVQMVFFTAKMLEMPSVGFPLLEPIGD